MLSSVVQNLIWQKNLIGTWIMDLKTTRGDKSDYVPTPQKQIDRWLYLPLF
jgi:hypothetical protein